MKHLKLVDYIRLFLFSVILLPLPVWANETLPHPSTHLLKAHEVNNLLATVDDSRDLMVTSPPKAVLPPELWEYLVFDAGEAKRLNLGGDGPFLLNLENRCQHIRICR